MLSASNVITESFVGLKKKLVDRAKPAVNFGNTTVSRLSLDAVKSGLGKHTLT